MRPEPAFARQSYDLIELYAGKARVSRLGRSVGYQCIAADVIYDTAGTRAASALNLNGNSGFTLLI